MFDSLDGPAGGGGGVAGWAVPGVDRPRPVVLPEAVLALQAAASQVLSLDLVRLTDAELLAVTQVQCAVQGTLRHSGLLQVGEVDRRRAYREAGLASTSRLLQSFGVEQPGSQVTAARRLGLFPLVAARLRDGSLPASSGQRLQVVLSTLRRHVDRGDGLIGGQPADQALAGVCNGIRLVVAEARGGFRGEDDPGLLALVAACDDVFSADRDGLSELAVLERALLLLADHVEPAQLSGCVSPLVHALLPNLLEQAEGRAHDERSLRLVPDSDGSGWTLHGRLDVDCGERMHAFLTAQLVSDHDPADTAAAEQMREQGLDPYEGDLTDPAADPTLEDLLWAVDELAPTVTPRSTTQRLHDALSSGLAQVLGSDLLGLTHDKQPVQITVTVPAETLDGSPGALPGRTGAGRPVSCRLVGRWACGSALTRHVLTLDGKVIATSHGQRTLTRAERRALHTQTGGRCQGHGCTRSTSRPGTVLHPHHATPWALTGTTSLADTVHLCDHCHRHVHHGKTLQLKDGRRLGPDGWLPPQRE